MATRTLDRRAYRRKRRERRHRYADKRIGHDLAWWYWLTPKIAAGLAVLGGLAAAFLAWTRVDHDLLASATFAGAVILVAAWLLDPRRRLGPWALCTAAALGAATVAALM